MKNGGAMGLGKTLLLSLTKACSEHLLEMQVFLILPDLILKIRLKNDSYEEMKPFSGE
jgi:hypothetical protein